MIISASRRTDIPSFYSEWFINRLREGYVYIPSPRNQQRYSKVFLDREAVDCIVFWTKNPGPMLDRLGIIDDFGYPYYFQFTLTPYGSDMEGGLPPKTELLDTFECLSRRIGPERLIWRWDPIILNGRFNPDRHVKAFERAARRLAGFTGRCVISFVDLYRGSSFREASRTERAEVAAGFAGIAGEFGTELCSCAESSDLEGFGVKPAACIDAGLIERMIGRKLDTGKDPGQRPACSCVESIDIGTYNTCANGCSYCYANSNRGLLARNLRSHNPEAPVLTGRLPAGAVITERERRSAVSKQRELFS